MSDRNRAMLLGDTRRHKDVALVSPASLSELAPLFVAAGLVLAIAGWLDVALFYYPSRFGDAGWELGTVGHIFDAMPLGTLGLVLMTVGIRARGGSVVWMRCMFVVLAIVGLLCLAGLVVLALDVPPALNAIHLSAVRADPRTTARVSSGLKLGIAKAIWLAVCYSIAYA
jgi:hypothetical protein